MGLGKKPFESIVEKGEIACTSNFSFPTMFSTLSKTEMIILVTFNLSSANAFNLVWSKILSCENGLKARWSNYYMIFYSGRNIIWRRTFMKVLGRRGSLREVHCTEKILRPPLLQIDARCTPHPKVIERTPDPQFQQV